MVRFFLLFYMALLSASVNAQAAAPSVRDVVFDGMVQSQITRVAAVTDPLTLQLSDGQMVRLSAIEIPDFTVHDYGPYATIAMQILQDMLVGKAVYLHQTSDTKYGRMNRMGHALAHVTVQESGLWAQGVLLSLGVARVRTTADNRDMASAMLALEAAARAEKIGMWADAAYAIKTPDNLESYMRSVQIVEGRVVSTTLNNNTLYLNFGSDWRDDFTVSIASQDRRRFSKLGLDPLQWGGKVLRVRGWIESYNGPHIKVDHPEAIEIIELEGRDEF